MVRAPSSPLCLLCLNSPRSTYHIKSARGSPATLPACRVARNHCATLASRRLVALPHTIVSLAMPRPTSSTRGKTSVAQSQHWGPTARPLHVTADPEMACNILRPPETT
jgi:hypothetical protein